MTESPFATIGGLRVEHELGSGGMGRVYQCKDDALDRAVAVKVLRPELLEQAEMRHRFLREARALARVSSPYVVAVHAVGEDPIAGPFVVMELLAGEDLQIRLTREHRIPWHEAVGAARDAVLGLKAAEAAGIIHRDVKPANLFIVRGRARLTDFGLAREVAGGAGVTQAGLVVGTPSYLAPEIVRGAPASTQSDLYSLGATLFHLIAGRPPFQAEAPLEVIAQAIRDPAPRLLSLVADVPRALDDLVVRMLAKDPANRPQGYDALDAELAAIERGAAEPAGVAGSPQRTMTLGTVPPSATVSPSDVLSAAATASVPVVSAAVAAPIASVSQPLSPPDPEVSSSGATMPRIKTATLTVMITDIAGYTERTSRVSREESARWLAVHDQLLQPVFRSFGGKVVKTLGDAFLVTFSSPTDAVLCACAIQDRLWHHNKGAKHEDAIEVRAALSAGEVRLHKGDVFGEPVNLASRLEKMAAAGEVVLSDAVFHTMNSAEVKLVSRGEHTLKGIARPVVVYAAVPDGVAERPPFGGRALGRVKESVVDGLVAGAPLAMQRAQAAAGPFFGAIGNAVGRVGDAVVARARADRRVAIGAAAVVAGAVLIAVLLTAGDSRLNRIDHGEAKAVAAEIERTVESKRTGKDWALLGHARLALDQHDRATAAWTKAAENGFGDERMKKVCMQSLAVRDDGGAVEVLMAWPGTSVDGDLSSLLSSTEWWPRHHALAILEARKRAGDPERQSVGLLDVTSTNCGDRRFGVGLLKKAGKGDDVVSTLEKLKADPLGNACLIFDVNAAIDAVKKRS